MGNKRWGLLKLGDGRVIALTNGNYVVLNRNSVTWGNGSSGITSTVSTANSLVSTYSNVLIHDVIALTNGNYVVSSSTLAYE